MIFQRVNLLRLAAFAAPVVFIAAAWMAPLDSPPGTSMTTAAKEFLECLKPEQASQARFSFESPERTNWHFIPLQDAQRKPTRVGIRLELLDTPQREKAMGLLRTGTSAEGAKAAETIMSLESLLHVMEGGKGNVRNPNWYFVSIYGEPGKGQWGWRFEGHHLSLNFTLVGDEVISVTPSVFASNPAEVLTGERKGTKPIINVQNLALELIGALDNNQIAKARQTAPHPEVEAKTIAATAGELKGLPTGDMNDSQRKTLNQLIQTYLRRFPENIGKKEWNRIEQTPGDLYFSFYRDETKPGKPMTYRIARKDFQIEFLNVQPDGEGNPANHIHSAFRTLPKDFGMKN